jgi:hypothetical protein
MLKRFKRFYFLFSLSLVCFAPNVLLAESEDMVSSIMKLRADVEALYTKIDENKEGYKTQMKSLALQIADSEAQINRLNTSIKLAELDLKKIQIQIANTSKESVEIKPLLKYGFGLLDTAIKDGIPFKVEERLSSLDKIKADLGNHLITEEKALALLWANYDDLIRLTSEIGLFKQNIQIDGHNVLATVAKIGSVMLYFSTPDDRVGYVSREGSGYTYRVVQDKEKRKQIIALFDAFKKQIRTGYFTIPNALIRTGG